MTSNVSSASAKPTNWSFFPISYHAILFTHGTWGGCQNLKQLQSQTTLSLLPHGLHSLTTSSLLSMCLIFSPFWQMLWIFLSENSEGVESTWLSKFSLLHPPLSGDLTRLLKTKLGRHLGLRSLLQEVLSSLLPTYFKSNLLLFLHIHSQGLCSGLHHFSSELLESWPPGFPTSSPIQRDIFLNANLITSVFFFKTLT